MLIKNPCGFNIKMIKSLNKKGQIWVETVVYTLIALLMIGAVLGVARPKIGEIQDKLTLDQTVEMLNVINEKIEEVGVGAGNKRTINIEIDKGEIEIFNNSFQEDEINKPNTIVFVLEESRSVYSEPATDATKFILKGNVVEVQTKQVGKVNTVKLKLDYEGEYNLEYGGNVLTKSPSAYEISIENKGNKNIKIEVK